MIRGHILFCALLFLDFSDVLAVDAEIGGRAGFKTLNTDFFATVVAVTVIVRVKLADSLFNLLDKLSFSVSDSSFKREFFFLGSTVDIVREVGGFIVHVVNGV